MNRPRVTATHESLAETLQAWDGRQWTSPGVLVTVSFDLHDHEAALKALERAVADVRAQIEETVHTTREGVHMIIIYRTTPYSVTWDVDGRRPRTSSAGYLASRKAYLVRTGGDEAGRVNVAAHMLDESQIDTLIAAIKAGA